MKKIMLVFMAFSLFLIASCSNEQNLVEFEQSELLKELNDQGIKPKLPTKFPMKIKVYELQMPPHESQIYPIEFIGESGEAFNLRIHLGDVTYSGDFEETVKINELEGSFTDDEITGLDLVWNDGKYHYFLNYQTIGLDTKVTKETMISIAESFK
ncbi:hypothetical protein [Metabacillus litoralis]|uniref:hypothetical protein n=1 Tax=Metabacillus litoralis TaxID=152268 RepID=UPI0013CE895B|nr:hypothetical protein [Metabacillus litoralis]